MNNPKNTSRLTAALYSGISLAALTIMSVAHAQDVETQTAADDDDVIIVEGVRASILRAIDQKRNADSVVDVIAAEDIGKFPDTNLAESLQRVTGVQITRDSTGQGSRVSIRGLNPFFSQVTVNGQTLAEPSSYEVGGSSGFDLSLLRSDLAGSLEVIKSPTADLEEGGVGGTINIRTRRPFDFDEPQTLISAGANYEELADEIDPDISFLTTKTFADGKFGVLLSGGYRERTVRNDSIDVRGWQQSDVIIDGEVIEDVLVLDRPRQRGELLIEDQASLGGTVQFRPTDNSMFYVDVLYGRTRADNYFQFAQWEFDRADTADPDEFLGGTLETDGDGVQYLTSGTFANMELGLENRFRDGFTETITYTAGGEWTAGDWDFEGAFSLSTGEDRQDVNNVGIDRRRGSFVGGYDIRTTTETNMGVDEPLTLFIPEDDPFDITDPLSFSDDALEGNGCGGGGFIRCGLDGGTNDYTDSEDINANFDIDKQISFGHINELEFGIRYKSTESNRSRPSTRLADGIDGDDIFPDITEISTNFEDKLGSLPFYASQPGLDIPTWYDLDAIFDIVEENGGYLRDESNVEDRLNTTQDIWAVYGMFNAEGRIGSKPYRANLGTRIVQTETSSDGFIFGLGGNDVPTTYASEGDYVDVLPSGNIAIDIMEDVVFRLAAAKVMTRPPVNATTASVGISYDDDNENEMIDLTEDTTFNYGNPDLEPFRAWQYDATLEWYTPNDGLVNIGFFYKDIESFITEERLGCGDDPFGFSQTLAFPGAIAPDGDCRFNGGDGNGELVIIQDVNSDGAKVAGFEAGVTQPFTFLPAPWDKFGVIANYTYVDSETNLVDPQTGVELPFEGVSENSYNLIGFFENDLFSARISYNYRDNYLLEDINGRCNCSVFQEERGQLDASLKVDVTENVQLSLDALNLTDERFRYYIGDEVRLGGLSENGRRFVAATRFKF